VQVGAVYLGASWVVLQIIDTLQGLLSLPDWVGPVAVLLLLVGLVVVSATAWVQSLPQTTAAEEAGDVPTDWEVAPAEAIESLRRGRLPHLTWGRAIMGGVMALSLLFGFAGLTVLVRGGGGGLGGPMPAGAAGTAEGIVVLPFHMSGEGMDVYREGMVDLMSANLDGLSDFRAVDARTLLARWNREIGETADVELERALRVAGATGARYAVVGSGVDVGSQVRFTASIYDLADGRQVGSGTRVEGGEDEVLSLIDALTVDVMRSILSGSGATSQAQTLRLASLLTESVPALRYYLEGDAHFRRARFPEARDAFQEAIAEDSTFALAYWRLGDTFGWMESVSSPRSREYRQRAATYADRLPERERTLLTVQTAIVANTFDESEMRLLDDYIERFPDDPDGWYLMGEVGLHAWSATGVSDERLEEALYRTVELDPTFSPYYEHAFHWATAKGHEERYQALLTAAEEMGHAPERRERMEFRWALFQGDEAERAQAEARLAELDLNDLARIDQVAGGLLDEELERLEPLWVGHDLEPVFRARLYGQQGRLAELVQLAEGSNERVLSEAVYQLSDWADAGEVPAELIRRLDERVGPRSPAEGDEYNLRLEIDDLLGRPIDAAAVAAWMEEEMDEFLPEIAAFTDTTGIRPSMLLFEEALSLERAGRAEEAFAVLERSRGLAPTEPPSNLTELAGRIALEAGELEAAVSMLEGVSRANHRTQVKFRLGMAYEELGDTAKALDAYNTFLSRTAPADEQLGAVIRAQEAVARLGG
jgi:tetratricopeptide (TPR) repeat protein